MLSVHTTARIASKDIDMVRGRWGPYYYTPLRLTLPDGSKKDFRTYLNPHFPCVLGPTVTTHSSRGIMHSEPFVNWKRIIDDNYPLKEDRLHNCDHQHIDGELTYYPTGYGTLPKVQIYPCEPVTTWSYVAIVGNVYCIDRDAPCVAFESIDKNDNEVHIFPGQHIPCALCWETGSFPVVENWLFADWGCVPIGRLGDLGWQTHQDEFLYCVFYHIWEDNTLKTVHDYVAFYSDDDVWVHQLRCTVKNNGIESIHDFEKYGNYQVPDPGSFEDRGPWYTPVYTARGPLSDVLKNSDHLLNVLDERYITDDVSITAGLAIHKASQSALVESKALDINSLMYLKDFAEVGKLISSYTALIKQGINPKTVSGAYLASHYGVRLTVKDTKKIIAAAKKLKSHVDKEYAYAYGREYTTCDNGVRLKANVSVAYGQYDQKWQRFLSDLSSLDVLPTPSRIWDMIAYSFVVDWFIPIGDMLEVYDALIRWVVTKTYRACSSVEAAVELDAGLFNPNASTLCGYGTAKYVHYKRNYSANPPFPLPWLDITEVDVSWNATRFLNAGALLVQRI